MLDRCDRQTSILPIVGRKLKIVADDYADPEQGSGAVKITRRHDFTDFEVGKRGGLDTINVLDASGQYRDRHRRIPLRRQVSEWGEPDAAIAKYDGLDRFEARTAIVAEMEERGLLDRDRAPQAHGAVRRPL